MNKTTNTTSSQVMELQQLIASPLMATIEADAIATQTYLNYLKTIAFETTPDATGSQLRYLVFNYREQIDSSMEERQIRIPLITMVPLPLLHVEEADFDFDIKILDALTRHAEERFDTVNESVETCGTSSASRTRLLASLAPKSAQTSNDQQSPLAANMQIKVKMRQSDMPAGLSNLLHIATESIYGESVSEQPENEDEEPEQ